jgi:hypothetical protein
LTLRGDLESVINYLLFGWEVDAHGYGQAVEVSTVRYV